MKNTESSAPTLYFDGACPVCSREVAMYRRQPGADGIRWVDVAHCTAADLGTDLTREAAMARLHLRRPDGSLVSGARAFVGLWQALPRWSWLGRLLDTRVAIGLLEAGYRAFLVVRRAVRGGPTVSDERSAPDSRNGALPVEGTALLPREAMPADIVADLRSDHAGETGAVCIYQGVLRFARDPALRDFALRHRATEQEHLGHIEVWLPPTERSRLLPVWRLADWFTGALPALLGPRAVYVTIETVERFVNEHYKAQIQRLATHPELANRRQPLLDCQGDEIAHRDEAAAARGIAKPGWLLRRWIWLVDAGSRAAVTVCRHV